MRYSILDPRYDYNQDKWVVSLVDFYREEEGSGGKLDGHAIIVVEGLTQSGRVFLAEYDITSAAYPEDQEFLQTSMGNILGVITEIRCNPSIDARSNSLVVGNEKIFHEYENRHLPSNSWHAEPSKVLAMIDTIERESLLLDTERKSSIREKRSVNWPFKYQKMGKHRFAFLGGNGGHNCVTWAEERLAIAGVGNGVTFTDSSSASPYLHTGNCTIS